jgi:uncharacterized protein (DUF1501 family)
MVQRRDFITLLGSASGAALLGQHAPGWAQGVAEAQRTVASTADRILILIELKGGNDGLNTVVPYTDPAYAQLRPSIALPAGTVLPLDAQTGLHPELKPLLPLWEQRQLAIVQGVGYPQPNLSHFRSIEIWATASRANEYLDTGWVGRAMRAGLGDRAAYTAEGVRVGASEQGVLAGARSVSLNNPESFVQSSRFAAPWQVQGNAALQHLLQVEADVLSAAAGLRGEPFAFQTAFPTGAFGNAVRAAAQVVASQRGKAGVPVITLSLGSFDTHQGQPATHANLLRQLAEGVVALKGALTELGAWDRTLVMTFSEFGRRPRQNQSQGTDHGTAAPHFVAGGAVRGGLYGQPPDFVRLDGAQNLVQTTDFRRLYATVARDWWGIAPDPVVRGAFEPIKFLHT